MFGLKKGVVPVGQGSSLLLSAILSAGIVALLLICVSVAKGEIDIPTLSHRAQSEHKQAPGTPSTGIFNDSGQLLGNERSYAVELVDIDNDDDLDACVVHYGQPNVMWLNDGHGYFPERKQLSLENNRSVDIAMGDIDSDGDMDAYVANYGNQADTVWLNDGAGNFRSNGQQLDSVWSTAVDLGDLDNDGDLDAFVTATYTTTQNRANRVWLNDSTGIFTNSGQYLGNASSLAVDLGDLDADGDLDAFVANDDGQPNTVWFNDSTGVFTDSGQLLGNADSQAIALGDFDFDGDLDAFVGNTHVDPSRRGNTVWLNDGTGHFTDSGQHLGSLQSQVVALGDVDSDSDLDVVVANNSGGNTVWLNDGSGNFTDSGQRLGNVWSTALALGDMNGDGDLDAFVANYDVDFDDAIDGSPDTVWRNHEPLQAQADWFAVTEDRSNNSLPILANDSKPDLGDTLSIVALNAEYAAGTVWMSGTAEFGYTPATDFNGTDTFSYTIGDTSGTTSTAVVDVFVNAVNDPPTDLVLSDTLVRENHLVGTIVGTFTTTDTDRFGDYHDIYGFHTYSLVTGTGDMDNDLFFIDGEHLKTNKRFDYEDNQRYRIRVRTADQAGLFIEKAFQIRIVDQDPEPAIVVAPTALSLSEDGTTDSYTITMVAEPIATVTLSVSVDEDTTVSTDTLTFTPEMWSMPRVMTATAVDDTVDEGADVPHVSTIRHIATSTDLNYHRIPIDDVIAQIVDNDERILSLSLHITATETITPGGLLPLLVSYQNDGNVDVSNVQITMTAPDYTTFNPDASSDDWQAGANSYAYTVVSGEDLFVGGAGGTLTFAVTVDNDAPAGAITASGIMKGTIGRDSVQADSTATVQVVQPIDDMGSVYLPLVMR